MPDTPFPVAAPERATHLPRLLPDGGMAERVAARLSDFPVTFDHRFGALSIAVPRDAILDILRRLKESPELAFEQLIDICAVDYPERAERFELS
jgi:NADH-quinone oxidoreductase subunit C